MTTPPRVVQDHAGARPRPSLGIVVPYRYVGAIRPAAVKKTAETIFVSFSEADAYRQCALKHTLAYKERWRTQDNPRTLVQGSLFHELVELRYRWMLIPNDETAEALQVKLDGLDEKNEMHQNVLWMFLGYLDHYGDDGLYRTISVEEEFEYPLEGSPFTLRGRIDRVVEHLPTGTIWVLDTKTCSALPKGSKDLDFDDQSGFYILAKRAQGVDVKGCIFDYVCSKPLKTKERPMEDRFDRQKTTRTDEELIEVERELIDTMRDAYRERPDGTDPPRSPNAQTCAWKCGMKEACLAGRKRGPVLMRKMLADMSFETPAMIENREQLEALRKLRQPACDVDQMSILDVIT